MTVMEVELPLLAWKCSENRNLFLFVIFGCHCLFKERAKEMCLTATGWFEGSVVVWWSLILWLGVGWIEESPSEDGCWLGMIYEKTKTQFSQKY